MVRIDYPGLMIERLPSRNLRYRVRVEGNVKRKIALPFGPEDPRFQEAYLAARAGQKYTEAEKPRRTEAERSVGWLWQQFEDHMDRQVRNGDLNPATLKQRRHMIGRFLEYPHKGGKVAEFHMAVPDHITIAFLDTLLETPAARKNTLNALKAMYRWADDRRILRPSPMAGIRVNYKSQGGATPWTPEDLRKFRKVHQPGTTAYLALTLFMFSACRVSDAIRLGVKDEIADGDLTWLEWQPQKTGTSKVSIPMLPPLLKATRSRKISHVSGVYILSEYGRPYRSVDSFRNRFKKWCIEAGLPDRSPHGIRKAAGHLLAHEGATQYEIMSVHGHSQAATSEVYTKDVERRRLAKSAINRLAGMEW